MRQILFLVVITIIVVAAATILFMLGRMTVKPVEFTPIVVDGSGALTTSVPEEGVEINPSSRIRRSAIAAAESAAPTSIQDGKSPETAISSDATKLEAPKSSSRDLERVRLIWMPSLREGRRCYLSLPTVATAAFVTLPEDWCEGLR